MNEVIAHFQNKGYTIVPKVVQNLFLLGNNPGKVNNAKRSILRL